MEYSTKALAKVSGVSVRTLRHYDQIGLLTPSIRMGNGRRLYGVMELVLLGQILSLKEFGFSLSKIKSILGKKPLQRVSALMAQKEMLLDEQKRLKSSLQMIDSMMSFYKENTMDMPANMEECFSSLKNRQEYQKYFDEGVTDNWSKTLDHRLMLRVSDKYFAAYKKKKKRLTTSTAFATEYGRQYGTIAGKLGVFQAKGIDVASAEVQKLMEKQWEILQMVYPNTSSKNVYFVIRDLCTDCPPEFKSQEGDKSLAYMKKAMTIFGNNSF
ncbi:MAG: hypothetical protein SP1CHLAM54_10260 [Chlamydiia bacterium]|nr:hypothetical protein [Chlamydiia bacterium]MCH9615932.1 hypothetical protein [Chlamydiia bacterium]MCH9628665.1 hypothetical protein [Chlamydiia bacterium]